VNKFKEILGRYEVPFNKTEEQALLEVERKIASGITSKEVKVLSINWLRIASAAAAIIIVASAAFFMLSGGKNVEFATTEGQLKQVELPDGSKATLNAATKISFNDDWSENRTVSLEGEAFFEVLKGSDFIVKTAQGDVRVLGTSFDVFARQEKFDVKCFTGKVEVSSQNQTVVLNPGNEINFENGAMKVETFKGSTERWIDEVFEFKGEPLENVLLEIERQFNVSIEVESTEAHLIDVVFTKADGLENALKQVCIPIGYIYSIGNNNWVVLKSKVK